MALGVPAAFLFLCQKVTVHLPFFSSSLIQEGPKSKHGTYQHGPFCISQRDTFIFPEDEKACRIPKLAGGRCSVHWSISWLVGSDTHSLYPKHPHVWGWTFDFNCCQGWRTWNFFVFSPCKTIRLYCDVCVKVATKAQPPVTAHLIPDLAWHHQSSYWTASFSPCFHQFDAIF